MTSPKYASDSRLVIFESCGTWWRHQMEIFPCYWPFVRGTHRSPVDSPHKGQWRGPLVFFFICAWTNGWANNRDAGDLRLHGAHYVVTVMKVINFTHKGTYPMSIISPAFFAVMRFLPWRIWVIMQYQFAKIMISKQQTETKPNPHKYCLGYTVPLCLCSSWLI